LHISECERDGDGLTGPAVEPAARLAVLAAPDQILITRTVADLVAGSGLRLEAAGETLLDGPAGPIDVFALTPDSGVDRGQAWTAQYALRAALDAGSVSVAARIASAPAFAEASI
jgi:class 3 adenylate cyclase